jgi:cytochrome b5
VYDVSNYLDEHPGGAEVMLDVAGQDADEFFEDIGHSKEARLELKKHYLGEFQMNAEAKAAMAAAARHKESASSSGGSMGVLLVVVVALVAMGLAYYRTQIK